MSVRRGVVVVFVLIFIAMAISMVGLVAISMVVGTPPSIPSNATLYLPLNAPFPEVEKFDVISQFVKRSPTLRETIDAIHKAKADSRVKALVVTPGAGGALWAQLQEVRAALEDFRTSGKPVTAYMEAGGAQEYYVASAADRIVLMPAGQLDLTGLATYELFFRGTLDKLGVRPDLLHIGDYKTYANTFTERGFTKAHLEMSQSLNRDWYDEMVRAIAAGRKKSADDIRKIIDNGPFLGEAAKQAGLVDQLAYEDQLDDEKPIAGTQRLDPQTYATAVVPSGPRVPGARIALLYAAGSIASGTSSFDGAMGLVIGSETFVEWLRKVRIDPSVKAVVVRIDSPGGSAIASEVIWREMMLTREKMPVIVSMGDVAASGGYYMAVPAHVIVAQPGTLTGSIGVVTGKFVLDGAADKLGVGHGVGERRPVRGDVLAVPPVLAGRARARRRDDADDVRAVPVARGGGPGIHQGQDRRRGAGARVDGPPGPRARPGRRNRRAGPRHSNRQGKGQTRPQQDGRSAGVSAEAVLLRPAGQPAWRVGGRESGAVHAAPGRARHCRQRRRRCSDSAAANRCC